MLKVNIKRRVGNQHVTTITRHGLPVAEIHEHVERYYSRWRPKCWIVLLGGLFVSYGRALHDHDRIGFYTRPEANMEAANLFHRALGQIEHDLHDTMAYKATA